MKISVLLSSYNRPNLIRRAIDSVVKQSHKDFELFVLDDNSESDIKNVIDSYNDNRIKFIKFNTTMEDRTSCLMMSKNINSGLEAATGETISYLADDDYYFDGWFESVVNYFHSNKEADVVYGKLKYIGCNWKDLFHTQLNQIIGQIDHNQLMHRKSVLDKLDKPYWPENLDYFGAPDGFFFKKLFAHFEFHAIDTWAAAKTQHGHNLLNAQKEYKDGNNSIKTRE